MKHISLILPAVLLSCIGVKHTKEDLLRAIRVIECGNVESPPDGDRGNAIGHYQIWRAYWIDATEFDKSIGGRYEDCRDRDYAEKIVDAYMRRYCPDAWSHETLDPEKVARIHNGGPKGHKKKATEKYWQKVSSALVQNEDGHDLRGKSQKGPASH